MCDIQVRFTGGIGNQLFQWAYGVYLDQMGHDVTYDTSFYDMDFTKVHNTYRSFQLPDFINTPININKNKQNRVVIEDQHIYKKHRFKPSTRYRLEGWWQSEKYFKNSEENIKQSINPYTNKSYPEYNFHESCSIHVRRTDYVTKYATGYPVMSSSYYRKAIDIIKPVGNIYIFSDDIEWCKKNIIHDNCIYVTKGTDLDQLKIMSLCNHNIVSNSSYSWWASWLNKHTDKKIIMPDIIALNRPYKDFYLEDAVKLSIE